MSPHWSPATYETASFADGPKVYAWLSERRELRDLDATTERRLSAWRNGECPRFDTLDRILLRVFDIYLWELPDDVWLHARRAA